MLATWTCPTTGRRVVLSPERAVMNYVPACLPRAMLSCKDEWTHIPDRILANSETVCSNLSVLLQLRQDRGGHTRPRIGNIRLTLSAEVCISRGEPLPLCIYSPYAHSVMLNGTSSICTESYVAFSEVIIVASQLLVAPVNNFGLSNSIQLFERADHFQDSNDLWIPEFHFVDFMNTAILRCTAR
jgi:hypothetical protein